LTFSPIDNQAKAAKMVIEIAISRRRSWMLKQYSIAQARDRFTSLVRSVERESAVELTRRGKPVAVMLSIQEYERLLARQSSFWEAYSAFRERVDLRELGIEPDTLFQDIRVKDWSSSDSSC
jgi:prevent-host-death family protein